MTRVGFEPTTPVFEREKAVHALGCVATVIDDWEGIFVQFSENPNYRTATENCFKGLMCLFR
jgi:hypothetical protein